MELLTMPVISTAHVTQETAAALTEQGDKNKWTLCALYEHGWFLYMQSDLGELGDGETPQDLLDLFKWARSEGRNFDYVKLDCDASKVAGLPTYEW